MLARIKHLLSKERKSSREKIKKIEQIVERIDAFFPYIIDSTSLKPAQGKDRDVQKFSLSAFKVFKKFLEEHNINYWIDFGNLLGAHRNGKFIPWDDDIDISMLREDFETLVTLYKEELKSFGFTISYIIWKDSSVVYKIYLNDLDFFVIDLFVYDLIKANDKNQVLKKVQNNISKKIFVKRAFKYAIENEFSTFYNRGYQNIQKILKKIKADISVDKEKAVDKEKEFLVMGLECFLQFPIISNNEDYFPLGQIEFEGILLPCPKNTAKHLELIYKDTSIKPSKIYNHSRDYSNLSTANQNKIHHYIDMLKDEKNFNISNDNLSQKEYWEKYYSRNREETEPSSFAKYIIKDLEQGKTLLDLGCGNGRDSLYFSNNKIKVVGIDFAGEEVCYLNSKFSNDFLLFMEGDMGNLHRNHLASFDYIYSRFSLHAISKQGQENLFQWLKQNSIKNTKLFIEVRSNKDEMLQRGTKISSEENITDHYRRYVDYNQLKQQIMDLGFRIIYSIESNNLSVYKDDNPVLIRIIAQKE